MSWFQQNRWLGTFLIAFAILAIASLVFWFTARNRADEAFARFNEAASEKSRLERLDPFPSEANYRKMKVHLENYGATLDKLKEELKTRVPSASPLAPNEFQSRLRQAILAISDKARANKVRLPDNFALGFDEYTSGLPNTAVAPLLGQQLAQIEALLNLLIDARVDAVTKFSRTPLPDERGAAPSPTPGAVKKPGAGAAAAGPKLVDRNPVDLTFVSAPSAARKVLNQIASANQQFYITRLLHVRNEKDKGPPREQPAGQAGTMTAPQPTPTPAKPAATPSAALSFIVGNEHIETSARVELIRFTF